MTVDWPALGRVAVMGLEECASELRIEHPGLLARPETGANPRFPLRITLSLSVTGDPQTEHLALELDFHLGDTGDLRAIYSVTQGESPFFKWGPEASIPVDDPRVLPWALAQVAASLEFFWDSLPEINAALAECLRNESES